MKSSITIKWFSLTIAVLALVEGYGALDSVISPITSMYEPGLGNIKPDGAVNSTLAPRVSSCDIVKLTYIIWAA